MQLESFMQPISNYAQIQCQKQNLERKRKSEETELETNKQQPNKENKAKNPS